MPDTGLHVFEIGPYSFIAHDVEDAWMLLKEHTGLERGDDDVGDDEPLQVEDGRVLRVKLDEDKPDVLALTAAEWCTQEGRGFLASTEY